jgi:hypothetical protein
MDTTIPTRDGPTLLQRRTRLSDERHVTFTRYKPEEPDSAPEYPIQWLAAWKVPLGSANAGSEQQAGPMPMPELIPAVEKALGVEW